MRIAYVTHSVSRRGGGIYEAVRRLVIELARRDLEIDVLGMEDDQTENDRPSWQPIRPVSFATRGPKAIGYLPGLRRELTRLNPDILHTHGLWKRVSGDVVGWHRQTGRPYVVSPHGMLDPWALRVSWWKKRLALAWFESQHLRRAGCLHALCEAELRALRAFELRNPICVIPNGVDLPDPQPVVRQRGEHTLVFLGRLHPKKGLMELLQAWSRVGHSGGANWRLVIAGWDDGGHETKLRELSQELSIAESVDFVGGTFGEAKERLLRKATACILPSFSEGLPVSVLEAWSYSVPVLMTDYCNLPEGFASQAAIRISNDPDEIAAGITKLFRLSNEEREEMGVRGRQLVEDKFSWPVVTRQLLEVYEWLLSGGTAPLSVVIN